MSKRKLTASELMLQNAVADPATQQFMTGTGQFKSGTVQTEEQKQIAKVQADAIKTDLPFQTKLSEGGVIDQTLNQVFNDSLAFNKLSKYRSYLDNATDAITGSRFLGTDKAYMQADPLFTKDRRGEFAARLDASYTNETGIPLTVQERNLLLEAENEEQAYALQQRFNSRRQFEKWQSEQSLAKNLALGIGGGLVDPTNWPLALAGGLTASVARNAVKATGAIRAAEIAGDTGAGIAAAYANSKQTGGEFTSMDAAVGVGIGVALPAIGSAIAGMRKIKLTSAIEDGYAADTSSALSQVSPEAAGFKVEQDAAGLPRKVVDDTVVSEEFVAPAVDSTAHADELFNKYMSGELTEAEFNDIRANSAEDVSAHIESLIQRQIDELNAEAEALYKKSLADAAAHEELVQRVQQEQLQQAEAEMQAQQAAAQVPTDTVDGSAGVVDQAVAEQGNIADQAIADIKAVEDVKLDETPAVTDAGEMADGGVNPEVKQEVANDVADQVVVAQEPAKVTEPVKVAEPVKAAEPADELTKQGADLEAVKADITAAKQAATDGETVATVKAREEIGMPAVQKTASVEQPKVDILPVVDKAEPTKVEAPAQALQERPTANRVIPVPDITVARNRLAKRKEQLDAAEQQYKAAKLEYDRINKIEDPLTKEMQLFPAKQKFEKAKVDRKSARELYDVADSMYKGKVKEIKDIKARNEAIVGEIPEVKVSAERKSIAEQFKEERLIEIQGRKDQLLALQVKREELYQSLDSFGPYANRRVYVSESDVRANELILDDLYAYLLDPSALSTYGNVSELHATFPNMFVPQTFRMSIDGKSVEINTRVASHTALMASWRAKGKNATPLNGEARTYLRTVYGMTDDHITTLSNALRDELKRDPDLFENTFTSKHLFDDTRKYKKRDIKDVISERVERFAPHPDSPISQKLASMVLSLPDADVEKYLPALMKHENIEDNRHILSAIATRLGGDKEKIKAEKQYYDEAYKRTLQRNETLKEIRRVSYSIHQITNEFNPDAKFSLGKNGPVTKSELESAINTSKLREIKDLYEAGLIKIVDKAEDIGAPENAVAVFRQGKSYLIANNLTPAKLDAVVLHEVGVHAGMGKLLGEEAFAKLKAEVSADPAFAKLKADLLATPNFNAKHIDEEVLAYAIEHAPELSVVQRVISAVKLWIRDLFEKAGLNAPKLTDKDLRLLAIRSLRNYRDNMLDQVGGSTPFSDGEDMYSLYKAFEKTEAGLRAASAKASKTVDTLGGVPLVGGMAKAVRGTGRIVTKTGRKFVGSSTHILNSSENPVIKSVGQWFTTDIDNGRVGIDSEFKTANEALNYKFAIDHKLVIDKYVQDTYGTSIAKQMVLNGKGVFNNEFNYKLQDFYDNVGMAMLRGKAIDTMTDNEAALRKAFSDSMKSAIDTAKQVAKQLEDAGIEVNEDHAVFHFAKIKHDDSYIPHMFDNDALRRMMGNGIPRDKIVELFAKALMKTDGEKPITEEAMKVADLFITRNIELNKLRSGERTEILANPRALKQFLMQQAGMSEANADILVDLGTGHVASRAKNRQFDFDFDTKVTLDNGDVISMTDFYETDVVKLAASYNNQAASAIASARMLVGKRTLLDTSTVDVKTLPKGVTVMYPDGKIGFNLGAPMAMDVITDMAENAAMHSKDGFHDIEMNCLRMLGRVFHGQTMSMDEIGAGTQLLKVFMGASTLTRSLLWASSVLSDIMSKMYNSRVGLSFFKQARTAISYSKITESNRDQLMSLAHFMSAGFDPQATAFAMQRIDMELEPLNFVSNGVKKRSNALLNGNLFNRTNRVNEFITLLQELETFRNIADKGVIQERHVRYYDRLGIPADKLKDVADYVKRSTFINKEGRLEVDPQVPDPNNYADLVRGFLRNRKGIENSELLPSQLPYAAASNTITGAFMQFMASTMAGTRLRFYDAIRNGDYDSMMSFAGAFAGGYVTAYMFAAMRPEGKDKDIAMQPGNLMKAAFERSAYSGFSPKVFDGLLMMMGFNPLFSKGRPSDYINMTPAFVGVLSDSFIAGRALARRARGAVAPMDEDKPLTKQEYAALIRTAGMGPLANNIGLSAALAGD